MTWRRGRVAAAGLALPVLFAAGERDACTGGGDPAAPEPEVRIVVAPRGLEDAYACYDLEVTNDLGERVWALGTEAVEGAGPAVCSHLESGTVGGGIAFVGACDPVDHTATDGGLALNTATLRLDGVFAAGSHAPVRAVDDPCPWPAGCSVTFTCSPSARALAVFHLPGAASDPSPTAAEPPVLTAETAPDPVDLPLFDLAREVDLALATPAWPWGLDGTWSHWSAWAAETFNSYTSLGMLPRITLAGGPTAPLVTSELQWAVKWDPATGADAGALSPAFYPPEHPFDTFRGHTLLWYGSPSLQKTGANAWDENVLPLWLREADAPCVHAGSTPCDLDRPYCPTHPAECGAADLAGMPLQNPDASLRELTLRRQVFLATRWLRAALGPTARVQLDVANEMVKTIPLQGGATADYARRAGEGDTAYYRRVMFPYRSGYWSGARVWADIRPDDPLYFLELAFRVAHAADPAATLFLNDYDPDGGAGVGPKSAALREVVESLRRRGAPVGGLGLQLHLRDQLAAVLSSGPAPTTGWWDPATATVTDPSVLGVWHPSYAARLRAYFASLSAYGVEGAVTELDYATPDATVGDAAVERRQARTYRDLLDACLDSDNCRTFVIWTAISAAPSPDRSGSGARGLFAALPPGGSTPPRLPAYDALLHGLWRAASPGAVVVEPEWIPEGQGELAGATATGGVPLRVGERDVFAFWENGFLSVPVTLPAPGTWTFDVWGFGTPAAGVAPTLALGLDGTTYGTFPIGPSYAHYEPAWVLPAGDHVATVAFTNDLAQGGEDRNVFVDAFALRPLHRVARTACHRIPVAAMGVRPSDATTDGGLAVTAGGAFAEAVSVAATGRYRLTVAGRSAAARPAALAIAVDGVTRATAPLPADGATMTAVATLWLARGTHAVSVGAASVPGDAVALDALVLCAAPR